MSRLSCDEFSKSINIHRNFSRSDTATSSPCSTAAKSTEKSPITVVKRAVEYKNVVLEKLRDQRDSQPQLCDMVICVGDHTFHVHKCLMIASCDYFDAMLRSGMQETRASSIELKGVSVSGFIAVVDFVYSGELKLNMNTIGDLIRVISHLQVKYALKLCEEFLIDETTVENCIEMMQLAELFSIGNVKNAVNRFILRNFDRLITNDQYKKLTFEQMKFFLQSNKLKLYPEIRVFKACVAWLRSYTEQPASEIALELFQNIRFNTMKPEEFVDIVTKEMLIKNDPKCAGLLIEAYEYFALPNRQYCSSSPRSQIRNEPSMVCVNESMYILNRREESWQYLCQSQATNKTLSQKFVVVNNFLYACGGYSETNRETCNKCHRFDPRTGNWYPIASMNCKRQFFTLASCNECIVAVGGVYGNVGNFYATFPVLSPLEVYSIEKNEWTSLKNCQGLPILKWPGACVFSMLPNEQGNTEKKVFIVGGKLTEGPNHSLSQQSFIVDLKTSEVELCSAPITTRFNPSVFHVANSIILFAGEDEKYRLAPCIEIFDLKTRQWSEVPATIPVSLSYQCISSTSMVKSRIYYLLEEHDGPSSESYILKSAYFDIKTCQFEDPVQLPHPSTLASKWCSLVFPQEYLERYQSLANSSCSFSNEMFDLRSVFGNCQLNDENSKSLSHLNGQKKNHVPPTHMPSDSAISIKSNSYLVDETVTSDDEANQENRTSNFSYIPPNSVVPNLAAVPTVTAAAASIETLQNLVISNLAASNENELKTPENNDINFLATIGRSESNSSNTSNDSQKT